MSNKIIIPFDGAKVADIESGGLTMFLGMESLRNTLTASPRIGIANNEKIIGFVIEEDGISIRIGKK
jgi:hypothetical protein